MTEAELKNHTETTTKEEILLIRWGIFVLTISLISLPFGLWLNSINVIPEDLLGLFFLFFMIGLPLSFELIGCAHVGETR